MTCCKDCKERCILCHSTCEKYISQNKKHKEEKLKEKAIKDNEYAIIGMAMNGSRRRR